MEFEGGCYCGEVRYRAEGDAAMKAQCHCRECQHISGGGPAVLIGMPDLGFAYSKGQCRSFSRSDLDTPVSREFCPNCGTHLVSRVPNLPMVLIKVGSMDDPSAYGAPEMVFFTCDKQAFHHIPQGVPTFDKLPT